jgi:hypothetical protein
MLLVFLAALSSHSYAVSEIICDAEAFENQLCSADEFNLYLQELENPVVPEETPPFDIRGDISIIEISEERKDFSMIYEITNTKVITDMTYQVTLTYSNVFIFRNGEIRITNEREEDVFAYQFFDSDISFDLADDTTDELEGDASTELPVTEYDKAITVSNDENTLILTLPALAVGDILIIKTTYGVGVAEEGSTYSFPLFISEIETNDIVAVNHELDVRVRSKPDSLGAFIAFLALIMAVLYFYKKPVIQAAN